MQVCAKVEDAILCVHMHVFFTGFMYATYNTYITVYIHQRIYSAGYMHTYIHRMYVYISTEDICIHTYIGFMYTYIHDITYVWTEHITYTYIWMRICKCANVRACVHLWKHNQPDCWQQQCGGAELLQPLLIECSYLYLVMYVIIFTRTHTLSLSLCLSFSHTCSHAQAYTHVNAHTRAHTHAHQMRVCVCTWVCICVYACVYTTHTHNNAHVNTHECL